MTIVDKFISVNYTGNRNDNGVPQKPIRITMHTAVASASSLYAWFNNPDAKASSNYYVNNTGGVECYVAEDHTAWANSNWSSNTRSFSIEHWDNRNPNDPVRTDALYQSSAELVAYLCKKYEIPCQLVSKADATNWSVKGIDLHNYFNSGKSCPAGLDVNRIINQANLILNQPIMADQLIKQYSQNLLGRTTDQQTDDFETNAWLKDGKDYGKWFDNFRQNQEVKDYNVTKLLDSNEELQATVDRQGQTITDQKVAIVELNKSLDQKDEQIKTLQQQLSECQAGQSGGKVIVIFGWKIIFVRNK